MYIRLIDGSTLYFPEAKQMEVEGGTLCLYRGDGSRHLAGAPLNQISYWWPNRGRGQKGCTSASRVFWPSEAVMTPEAYYDTHPELWEYSFGNGKKLKVPYWVLPPVGQRKVRAAMEAEANPQGSLFETRKEQGYGVD